MAKTVTPHPTNVVGLSVNVKLLYVKETPQISRFAREKRWMIRSVKPGKISFIRSIGPIHLQFYLMRMMISHCVWKTTLAKRTPTKGSNNLVVLKAALRKQNSNVQPAGNEKIVACHMSREA